MSRGGMVVKSGKKWKGGDAVQQAKAHLQHKALLGNMGSGRAGLRSVPSSQSSNISGNARRRLIQQEVHAAMEEEHQTSTMAM